MKKLFSTRKRAVLAASILILFVGVAFAAWLITMTHQAPGSIEGAFSFHDFSCPSTLPTLAQECSVRVQSDRTGWIYCPGDLLTVAALDRPDIIITDLHRDPVEEALYAGESFHIRWTYTPSAGSPVGDFLWETSATCSDVNHFEP